MKAIVVGWNCICNVEFKVLFIHCEIHPCTASNVWELLIAKRPMFQTNLDVHFFFFFMIGIFSFFTLCKFRYLYIVSLYFLIANFRHCWCFRVKLPFKKTSKIRILFMFTPETWIIFSLILVASKTKGKKEKIVPVKIVIINCHQILVFFPLHATSRQQVCLFSVFVIS